MFHSDWKIAMTYFRIWNLFSMFFEKHLSLKNIDTSAFSLHTKLTDAEM